MKCKKITFLAPLSVLVQDTIDVTVTVTDCNDNKPCFMSPVSYTQRCEGDPVDSIAATFAVTDSDNEAPNNVYDVEIVTGTNGPLMGGVPPFKLVGVSGAGDEGHTRFCAGIMQCLLYYVKAAVVDHSFCLPFPSQDIEAFLWVIDAHMKICNAKFVHCGSLEMKLTLMDLPNWVNELIL